MRRTTNVIVLWVAAVLALLVSGYCFLGVAMTGSFSVAAGDPDRYRFAAKVWTYSLGGSFLLAVVLTVLALKISREIDREQAGRAKGGEETPRL